MRTFYRAPGGALEEIAVGEWVTIDGERRRVVALTVQPAEEADAHLGVEAGDLIAIVELSPAAPGVADKLGEAMG